MRPVIFSGTTEGRMLSEKLSEARHEHIVCVATEYGELVMDQNPYADIRPGRLDAGQMEELIKKEASCVYDATHPYAAAVSDNIRRACLSCGKEYVRVLRSDSGCEIPEGLKVRYFDDTEECAGELRNSEGNILLTTGTKTLRIFAENENVRNRLYARVLPVEESIESCAESGLSGKQIIAMQGPFSADMNKAMIRQFGIRLLVTKESGSAGGFPEKISAACETGTEVWIIKRPAAEEGISVDEACRRLLAKEDRLFLRADIVGIGPGRTDLVTEQVREAVSKAEIIFGAGRMTEAFDCSVKFPYYRAQDIIPVIEKRRPGRIAVLFSGDTGFYSGAKRFKPALEEWLKSNGWDYDIRIMPGISSYSYLSSVLGVEYTDSKIISLHGKSGDPRARAEFIRNVRNNTKTFSILSGAGDVRMIGEILNDNNLSHIRVVLGFQLSYPDEKILFLSPEECLSVTDEGLYTALLLNDNPEPVKAIPVYEDEAFIRGKVPMTKASVRHLSVIRLGLSSDSVLYDIGSGTGSVACEAAALNENIRVYAVEKKEEAIGLIRQNARSLGLHGITVVEGTAPEALEGLEPPTHAFIGGSSGNLRGILDALRTKSSGIRIVINAVSLETIAEIQSVIRDYEVSDLTLEQVSVSRARELGSYHLMTAENPVLIASFVMD